VLKIVSVCKTMLVIKPIIVRPHIHLRAKSTDLDDFPIPSEAPGEGKRRFPTWDERDPVEDPPKKVNPIKKFLMDMFKIDHEKFREDDKWASRIKNKTSN
jgi:hypothetical protein